MRQDLELVITNRLESTTVTIQRMREFSVSLEVGKYFLIEAQSFSKIFVVAVHELLTFPLLSLNKYFLEKYFNFKKTIPDLYNLWTANAELFYTYW